MTKYNTRVIIQLKGEPRPEKGHHHLTDFNILQMAGAHIEVLPVDGLGFEMDLI